MIGVDCLMRILSLEESLTALSDSQPLAQMFAAASGHTLTTSVQPPAAWSGCTSALLMIPLWLRLRLAFGQLQGFNKHNLWFLAQPHVIVHQQHKRRQRRRRLGSSPRFR